MKKLVTFLLLITTLLSCASCDRIARNLNGSKTYTVENMSFTVDDMFWEVEDETFVLCLDSKEIAVYVQKETTNSDKYKDFTAEEYAKNFIKQDNSEIKFLDKIPYSTYTVKNDNGKEYIYFAAFYKNGSSFWSLQFVCESDDYDYNKEDFEEWAKSVTFS